VLWVLPEEPKRGWKRLSCLPRGLPDNALPIKGQEFHFRVKVSEKLTVPMACMQFPVTPAIAMTPYKVQGKVVHFMFVLQWASRWSRAVAYVIFSRVRRLVNLFLLVQLSQTQTTVFSKPPELVAESVRLAKLAAETHVPGVDGPGGAATAPSARPRTCRIGEVSGTDARLRVALPARTRLSTAASAVLTSSAARFWEGLRRAACALVASSMLPQAASKPHVLKTHPATNVSSASAARDGEQRSRVCKVSAAPVLPGAVRPTVKWPIAGAPVKVSDQGSCGKMDCCSGRLGSRGAVAAVEAVMQRDDPLSPLVPAAVTLVAAAVGRGVVGLSDAREVVVTLPSGSRLDRETMRRLCPEGILHCDLINAYPQLLQARNNADVNAGRAVPTCVFLNIFFFQHLYGPTGYTRWHVDDWAELRVYLNKVDMVMTVGNHGGGHGTHWTLAVAHFPSGRVEHYDSLGSAYPKVIRVLQRWWKEEALARGLLVPVDPPHEDHAARSPQQTNSYNCGVFARKVADALSRRQSLDVIAPRHMPYLRLRMAAELLAGRV